MIWYNKEIFKKLNLEAPKTYQDLVTASKKLTGAGYIPVYQGAADGWQNENVFLISRINSLPASSMRRKMENRPGPRRRW